MKNLGRERDYLGVSMVAGFRVLEATVLREAKCWVEGRLVVRSLGEPV